MLLSEIVFKISKQNYPKLIRNLLSNKEEFIELRKELFTTGKNLKDLS